jgi:N-methylhydantoinase B/oxoprolinase/acetone carboxylase alpha subunit
MTIDGFSAPVDLKVKLTVRDETILADFEGTSGLDKKAINVPLRLHQGVCVLCAQVRHCAGHSQQRRLACAV